jgi:Tfp pilus assembly protein PilF
MFTRYSLACVLLVSISPVCLALSAEGSLQGISETASIVGYVHDANSHDPVMAARIEISSPKGIAMSPRFSTTNGEFHIEAGDGDYTLTIQKDGYQTAQMDVSVVVGHQTRVDVDLVPTEPESAPSSAESVSKHQLTVPGKARHDYEKAMARMAAKDYPGAIALFQKAIDTDPSYYEAYAEMGVTQYMLGQVPTARESLQKSIDLSSGKYSNAIFDLADVLNSTRDYGKAEPLARKGIALDDSSWRGYFELARALTGLKRFPDAEQSAVKSRTLNPQNLQLYVVLTNIHLGMHNYNSALVDIDAYLKLDPSSPASNQMRAMQSRLTKALAASPTKTPQPQP